MKRERFTVDDFRGKKLSGEKITMLTAYDYFMARAADEAGIDAILVGDSLGMVVLGRESTRDVTMEDMIRHASAARKGCRAAFLIGDMPYGSFATPDKAVRNARRFADEAGCDAVKVEGEPLEEISAIIKEGIPVLGHLGLTPQTATDFKVRGKDAETAQAILSASRRLEGVGCFAVVLECVPAGLAGAIRRALSVPVIGIGAGPECDGQVLVVNDMLGMYDKFTPKFVKRYADLGGMAGKAISLYIKEVANGAFPTREHSFTMRKEELDKLSAG